MTLQQTRNTFKVVGITTRLDKDGAYKEDQMTKGAREGDTYRALRFGVRTSDTNEITVSMFDYEPEKVFLWNSEMRKSNPEYKGETVSFGEWEERKDELKDQGYAVLQTRVGVEHDDKGKIKSEGLPSYVASEYIYDNLHNGDSVVVEGEIRYSRYEDRNGKVKEQTNYTIKKLYKLKDDVDFDVEGFEEVTYFEQELVFVDAENDKEEGKVNVTGRTIDYRGNFFDSNFVVNYKTPEGKNDPDMVKLAETFMKRFKFGDLLTVYGDTLNRVVLREVQEEKEDDDADLFAEFGGRKKPKHAESFVARDYITEMSVQGIDALEEAMYTDEDFVKDEVEVKEDKSSEFGGKSKKDNPFTKVDEDPFAEGSNEEIEDDSDDLPF